MANTIIGEAREAGFSIRSSGGVPILEETYVFLVEAESKNTSRFSVSQTPGLPVVGFTFSAFGLTTCRSKTAERRVDQPRLWDVTCTFSSEVEENQDKKGGGSEFGAEPTEWIPIYETKFERMQEIVNVDASGVPVATSAKQMFPEGISRGRFIPIWEFYQFEPPTVTDETIIGRNEVVNSTTFKGRAAKTLLCTVISSQVGFYYGAKLRFTRYALRYNDRTWQHKRLDVGTVYISGGAYLPYLDDAGNVFEGPLNGTGGKQTVGTAPAVLSFDQYAAVDFATFLRLPA